MKGANAVAVVSLYHKADVRLRFGVFEHGLQSLIEIGVNAEIFSRFCIGKEGVELVVYEIEIAAFVLQSRLFGQRLGLRSFCFCVGQYSLIVHEGENVVAAQKTFFFVPKGGIAVGGSDESGEHGAFGGGDFGGVFPEIKSGGVFHAECAVTEIDGVEIQFENFLFGIAPFQLSDELPFPKFTAERLFSREMCVFDELLRNGRSALPKGEGRNVFEYGFPDSEIVQALMIVKAFVLYGDESGGEVGRERGEGDRLERGVQLLSVSVKDGDALFVERKFFGLQTDPCGNGNQIDSEGKHKSGGQAEDG